MCLASYLCMDPYPDLTDYVRSDADDAKQKLTVLQPMKGNIANILIMGAFKWQDS